MVKLEERLEKTIAGKNTFVCSVARFVVALLFNLPLLPSIKLISVKGLGCKMTLPILALGEIDGIMDAIERENILYLKKFPKIGEKVAKQIILDLKGKLNTKVIGKVNDNFNNHDDNSSLLVGNIEKDDIIKIRKR